MDYQDISRVYATDIQGRQISFTDGIWQPAMPCSWTGQVPHHSELPGLDGYWDFNQMSGCRAELRMFDGSEKKMKKYGLGRFTVLVECGFWDFTMKFPVQMDDQAEAERLAEAVNIVGDRLDSQPSF